MELTHQLAPMLRTLRLSGILETLDVRNRQAVVDHHLVEQQHLRVSRRFLRPAMASVSARSAPSP